LRSASLVRLPERLIIAQLGHAIDHAAVVDAGVKSVSAGAHCRHSHVAGMFGSEPGRLHAVAQVLPVVPDLFERLTTLLAIVAGFLGASSKQFGFMPRSFGCDAMFFGGATLLFVVLTPGCCLAHAVGFQARVLGCAVVAHRN
jgi:hypothetical protein